MASNTPLFLHVHVDTSNQVLHVKFKLLKPDSLRTFQKLFPLILPIIQLLLFTMSSTLQEHFAFVGLMI